MEGVAIQDEATAHLAESTSVQIDAIRRAEPYCPVCWEVHPRSICAELTRGVG